MTSTSSPTATVASAHDNEGKAEKGQDTAIAELARPQHEFTKDFGFLPIPRRLRYDPDTPPHFGLALNIAFGFASTFSEYYQQSGSS
ncbi:hypothetical protein D9619_007463 [Psilocybe cf. subviscida]|uniref:Uncharacterized protein n=1 Tax=Psilocybe cf. subviscida TaxID=2480587 RepID=A0A8H5B2K1_9AGAR|nr:hypothetical protein D9619_007463 [Psilocybe cf. subviscida]